MIAIAGGEAVPMGLIEMAPSAVWANHQQSVAIRITFKVSKQGLLCYIY